MGCDGGTIPKRDELVRTKKKPEQKDKQSELSFLWGHCSITQEPLQKPIVACQLGRLYNKLTIIETLLDKAKLPEAASHIKNIKDVKELNLTDNKAFVAKAKTNETYDESLIAPYVCPVIGLEMNGKFRFIFFWSCGCVISERAYKAVPAKLCHKCQKPFTEDDIIILNGTDEDVTTARVKMDQRKIRSKAAKKNKDLPANEAESKDVSTSNDEASKPSTSGCGKKLNGTSKRSAPSDIVDPAFKKTKSEYSVAKDPKASEVFKSIFTSHQSASKQNKAHWVTYNPFYN